MPRLIEPMMAVAGELPAEADASGWGLELKWDGVRAITYRASGADEVRATSRRGGDITGRYPELRSVAELVGGRGVVLDGEVVAFDEDGRPSFELLQRRMHVGRADAVRHLMRDVPVTYVVFDVLHLDGHSIRDEPYERRRALLESLGVSGGRIHVPEYFHGGGVELLEATRQRGLEGVVAKRLDSVYRPGSRARTWRKVKHTSTCEVVIGGWKPGQGARGGGIGSLLIGMYDERGLRFVGHVGTGFTERMLTDLARMLWPLEATASPYVDEVPREFARDAHWVEPLLVGEVVYTSWTKDGRLRAPSWRGLREDVPPEHARVDHP